MMYALAIMDDNRDEGFSWGTERTHLLGAGTTAEEAIHAALSPTLEAEGGEGEDEDGIWEGMRDTALIEADGAEMALADAGCPSAGSGDAWEDDVWLGVADYLSHMEFRRLAGLAGEGDYIFPDWGECVRIQGRSTVVDALNYLPDAVKKPALRGGKKRGESSEQ